MDASLRARCAGKPAVRALRCGGANGVVGSTLGGVEVAPIPGKAGWLVRHALNDRLESLSNASKKYQLVVELDDKIESLGIRSNDTVTRERRTLRARYKLVDNASGKTLIDATAGSDAGIDVVSSEYATIAAENSALENLSQTIANQIIARLSLYARKSAKTAANGAK